MCVWGLHGLTRLLHHCQPITVDHIQLYRNHLLGFCFFVSLLPESLGCDWECVTYFIYYLFILLGVCQCHFFTSLEKLVTSVVHEGRALLFFTTEYEAKHELYSCRTNRPVDFESILSGALPHYGD